MQQQRTGYVFHRTLVFLCITISRTVASSTTSTRMTAISPTTTPTKTPVEIKPASRLDTTKMNHMQLLVSLGCSIGPVTVGTMEVDDGIITTVEENHL